MYRSSAALLLLALAGVCADLFAEDGVLVDAKGEVRTIAGLWTVFIIIHPPVRPDTETRAWFFCLVFHREQTVS